MRPSFCKRLGWLWFSLIALVPAAAAGEPSAPEPPTLRTAGAKTCTLGPAEQVAAPEGKRLFSFVTGAHASGALLAWSSTPETAQVLPLSLAGKAAGAVQSVQVAAARRLWRIFPAGNGRTLLMTHGVCDPAIRDHKCLVAQVLGADGKPEGTSARIDTNEWVQSFKTQLTPEGLLVLFRTVYKGPRLVRFALSDPATPPVTVKAEELKDFASCYWSGIEKAEQMDAVEDDGGRLVWDGKMWIVAHPSYANVPAFLCTQKSAGKPTPIRGLPPHTSFINVLPSEGALALLYRELPPEESDSDDKEAPRWMARIGLDGKPLAKAVRAPDGKPVPAPFSGDEVVTYQLREGKKGTYTLDRFGARQQRVGEPLLLPSTHDGPRDGGDLAVTWASDHFLLTYASYEKSGWHLYTANIRCGAP